MRKHTQEEKAVFENGATRSQTSIRYDLVPTPPHRRNAARFGLGAAKHGEHNWEKGGKDFIVSCINHLEAHLYAFKQSGNLDDDNLAAIATNAYFLMWFEEMKMGEFQKALLDVTSVKNGQ
jgi:hypothetical protein